MEKLKKIKNLSTAGTIICILTVVIYIVLIVVMIFGSESLIGFASDNMDKMTDIDSNSPSAGFELIGYLAGGGLSFIGGLVALLIAFFLGSLSVYQLPAIISGFVANGRYKKKVDEAKCISAYKTDGYIKVIMNGIILALTVLLLLSDIREATFLDNLGLLTAVWNYIAVFLLGMFQINCIKEINQSIE